ncbi:MAG: DUF1127 domain-containing protein [bacterium]
MNATLQSRPAAAATAASPLARAYGWIKHANARARARRSLAQVDARTLRDIGFTRRDLAVFTVAACAPRNSLSSGPR